jgi:parvulin-like peptidyl-prolyl isomerase
MGNAKWGVLVVFLILTGCKKKESEMLVRVGKSGLTEVEFYGLIPPQYAGVLTSGQKKELLKKWIDTELVYQQALKDGIHKEDALALKLRELRREIIANEYLERYISKIGSVDESEVRKYFDLHKKDYEYERKVAEILVADKEQASRVVQRLKAGESFSDLVKECSVSPSAQSGGVSGFIRRGDMPQLSELEEALFSLEKTGDVSDVIETNFGYYIVKLVDVKKLSETVNYEKMKDGVRNMLNQRKRKDAFVGFMEGLRQEVEVEANYDLLE